ncbi:MAG: hypothetical protein K2P39_06480 [Lachnospiraceae bacterium]|nr:hypothetical protein [Lachnospiraceae bacterium]
MFEKSLLRKFYDNLAHHGELYFIEVKAAKETAYTPIGDVTFWQQDMPVVIGEKAYRGKGIAHRVARSPVERGRLLG